MFGLTFLAAFCTYDLTLIYRGHITVKFAQKKKKIMLAFGCWDPRKSCGISKIPVYYYLFVQAQNSCVVHCTYKDVACVCVCV